MNDTSRTRSGTRLARKLVVPVTLVLAAGLGGCVYAPPYGYAPAPAYGYAPAYCYAYGPGYYAAPSVSVGVGFSSWGGHWHGH